MYISADKLKAGLTNVLAAPKDSAEIDMLCLRPNYGQRNFVDQMTVTAAEGIPGERWLTAPWLKTPDGSPDPGIQVSIISKRVLDLVWQDRENTPHPGDTFVVDMDLGTNNLPEGTLLSVGSAVLRVSEHFNDGCVKWKARYGVAALEWLNYPDNIQHRLRGILCSIHTDGVISRGDLLQKHSS